MHTLTSPHWRCWTRGLFQQLASKHPRSGLLSITYSIVLPCRCLCVPRRVYYWRQRFLIWGWTCSPGKVLCWQWDSLQWLEPASSRFLPALLAGQPIHSGNQKQGLRKWVLSEVTSHWGSTCFRSGKARTGTSGIWEYSELACRVCQVRGSSCICVGGGGIL